MAFEVYDLPEYLNLHVWLKLNKVYINIHDCVQAWTECKARKREE